MNEKASKFDWSEIHARLERDMARLGTSIADDSVRTGQSLRARTAQLAAISARAAHTSELLRAIVLRVGQERYALPIDSVHEVTKLASVAVVPGAGNSAVGIINWHGELVMAYGLAPLIGIDADENATGRKVVVLRGGEPGLALVVDSVEHVVEIDVVALQPVDPNASRQADIFRGMTSDALLLIDDARLKARLHEELEAA